MRWISDPVMWALGVHCDGCADYASLRLEDDDGHPLAYWCGQCDGSQDLESEE